MPEDSTSKRETVHQLRERKERKHYTDDWTLAEEELEGKRAYRIEDKLESDKYSACFVKEMKGSELTLEYIQRHGFATPILVHDKAGLGIKVPSQNFTVNDVRICVGSRRVLDVMDTATQRNAEMTLKEWQRYFEGTERDRILNVISLEFSKTRLEQYVEAPRIVRQIDWVDRVWPKHLKEQQQESTNLLDDMMYPKVQKYCLMSVKGCFTDFHVDFGGTSVWYHVLRGRKVFWLAPPTERNLRLYEQWVLSGKQSDAFLGDAFDKCGRVLLIGGDTFFIPSGWIHAVYTPEDSLVFGGNFLHSFGVEKQLRIAQVEDTTRVPQKFRYPFFTEMLWYVLARYVECVLGRDSLKLPEGAIGCAPKHSQSIRIHLTPFELHGLKAIVMYLHALPANKKNVPEIIRDVVGLIRDVRTLVEHHRHDSAELAVTNRPILTWTDEDEFGLSKESTVDKVVNRLQKVRAVRSPKSSTPTSFARAPRRRRTRCRRCEACLREDCGECAFCRDMVKFGGAGRAKQSCMLRQCLQPMLPITSICRVCGKDGWGQAAHAQHKPGLKEESSTLMECSVCWEIVHPECAGIIYGSESEGVPNEDLPNSWECPQCCRDGRNLEAKPRHFRARSKVLSNQDADVAHDTTEYEAESGDSEGSNRFRSNLGSVEGDVNKHKADDYDEVETKKIKLEASLLEKNDDRNKGTAVLNSTMRNSTVKKNSAKPLKNQLASKLQSLNLPRPLKRPMYPVRPAPVLRDEEELSVLFRSSERSALNLALEKSVMVYVFRFLSVSELCSAMLVCRIWNRICADRRLWTHIDLSHRKIGPTHMTGVVRRQPEKVDLSWSSVTRKQLEWLVGRLPHLSHLALQGCSWHVVSALRTCSCPLLSSLDLRFVDGLNDTHIRDILSPPLDSRPGLVDSKSRLRNLRELRLAGCDISDVSLRYIAQHLKLLCYLDISSCYKITDAGIALLAASGSSTKDSLVYLDLQGCKNISDAGVDHLKNCEALVHVDLQHTPLVTYAAVRNLVSNSHHQLQASADKLIELKAS